MKNKLNKIGLGVAASIVMLAAPLSVTHAQVTLDTFVVDPYGQPVKDPYDECIQALGGKNVPECIGVAPVATVAPPPAPAIEQITLSADTNFDFDEATLRPEGERTLDRLAEDIRRADAIESILVVGHTDSIGTEAYNQDLSERRAASVKDYLVQQGINPNLITTRGMGESQPIAPNTINGRDNPEGRAQNRRVEITVEAQQQVMREPAAPRSRLPGS